MLADFTRAVVDAAAKQLGYHDRKERQICTRYGCELEPADESGECEGHRDDSRARKRKSARRRRHRSKLQRRLWRKQKRCVRCGGKRVSGEECCATCLVTRGEAKAARVDKQVDKSARIEAATSVDAGGRSRYRGQARKGRQSVASVDAKDLEYAIDALYRAREGLAFAAAPENELPKAARREAVQAALALATHASRFVDDVLARHGFFKTGKVAPRGKSGKR